MTDERTALYKRLCNRIRNYPLYHLHYKHTKKHKQELKDTANRVYDRFLDVMGYRHPQDKRQ